MNNFLAPTFRRDHLRRDGAWAGGLGAGLAGGFGGGLGAGFDGGGVLVLGASDMRISSIF